MGSVANPDATLPEAVVPKRELSVERYTSSAASSPECDDSVEANSEKPSQDPAPAPKRKGGRKPVCSRLEVVRVHVRLTAV